MNSLQEVIDNVPVNNNTTRPRPKVFIKKLIFNDRTTLEIDENAIIVFVGSNNSGKSQVLKDIIYISEDRKNKQKIIQDIELIKENDLPEYIQSNYEADVHGNYHLSNHFAYNLDTYKKYWEIEGLHSNFRELFFLTLDTEQRLIISRNSPSYDADIQHPENPVQKLYANRDYEVIISDLFRKVFKTGIVVDRLCGHIIKLRLGDRPIKSEKEEVDDNSYRLKMRQLPVLEEQGDGMRSFASIMLNLFTGDHNVMLIDEPEAFLHPPQARALGNILAELIGCKRQLFISTHSEDFLKGLIDIENENVKVVRMDRRDTVNHIKILSNQEIKKFWSNPLLRYSNILSGLFHSKIVICESDSDCKFYKAMVNEISEKKNKVIPDIFFTHCGGKQRIKDIISAFRPLEVNVLAICDIDVLNDKNILKTLIESVGLVWTDIQDDWTIVNNFIVSKSNNNKLIKADVMNQIQSILNPESSSTGILMPDEAKKIQSLVKQNSPWSDIKKSGIHYFNGASYTSIINIIKKCEAYGLLILEVGELESFYKPSSSALHGPGWINQFFELGLDLYSDSELESARSFAEKILQISNKD